MFMKDHRKKNITGIILAGGQSSRMGKDKGLVKLNGRPLAEYAVDILKQVSDTLLISTQNREYEYLNIPLVEDIYKQIGPMGGVYAGLMHSGTEVNAVLSCDMPFVSPRLFELLMDEMQEAWVVLPSVDGVHPEPMCGIYSKKILPSMEQFIRKGNYALPALFQEIPFKMIKMDERMERYPGNSFLNINTEEELRNAERMMAGR